MAQTHPDDPTPMRVDVTRTGGLAGIERAWSAEPAEDETSAWAALIDRCPWDAPPLEPAGADRYVWVISAVCGPDERRAELPDAHLVGAWRELVDAVRDRTAGPDADRGQSSAR